MQNDGYSIDSSNMTPEKTAETAFGMRVLEKLLREYPGYNWHVEVNFAGQVCTVRTEFGGQWGYVLHLEAIVNDPDLKLVRWAGGELLERFNLSREKANLDIIDSLAVNARGFATPQR